MAESDNKHTTQLSAAGILIAFGIIYGDIGTSPIYTFRFIVGSNPITDELILGGLSCVFWTLTVITTFKYVYLALDADNKGEGGIFALYALVRRYKSNWVIFPAVIGCATLISDGFITPAISVTSAVEGLRAIDQTISTNTIITIVIV
ncbi:MAG TPA: KUP/HAK/KT family potassium transporter, partial [Chryseosolibacter sp.]|nr:KUP/HAK/KT family potassium transporter [Chryseosolibacter sp.]